MSFENNISDRQEKHYFANFEVELMHDAMLWPLSYEGSW